VLIATQLSLRAGEFAAIFATQSVPLRSGRNTDVRKWRRIITTEGRRFLVVFLTIFLALGITAVPGACQQSAPPRSARSHTRDTHENYRQSQHRMRRFGHELNLYSERGEKKLGGTLAHQIESRVKVVSDPILDDYLRRISIRLALPSDVHLLPDIRVVLDPEMNAYSLPGHVYLNTGLILGVHNEAELAGTIAHELGHLVARHSTATLTRLRLGLPLRTFRVKSELEADRLAVQYMYGAGYHPTAFADLLETLFAKPDSSARVRIRHIKETVSSLPPNAQDVVDSREFQEIKLRISRLLQREASSGADVGSRTLGRPLHAFSYWVLSEPPLLPRYAHFLLGAFAITGLFVVVLGLRKRDTSYGRWLVEQGAMALTRRGFSSRVLVTIPGTRRVHGGWNTDVPRMLDLQSPPTHRDRAGDDDQLAARHRGTV
jgi:Zn-dependent protease with chaperone function